MPRIPVIVRHLEMRQPPPRRLTSLGASKLSLQHIHPCPVALYRDLYRTVGGRQSWIDRELFNDEQLTEVLAKPATEIFILHQDRAAIGFFELNTVATRETEFLHVGLLPAFRGKGVGPHLVQAAFDRAWSRPIERVYGRTSSLDHPTALRLYLLLGATVYREEEVWVETTG